MAAANGPEKTELWLVRHGETEWSLDGRHTSFTDIPLTDHGRQRAAELRDFLKEKTFAAVYTSPRQRAQETCRLAGFGEVLQTNDDLQEWNYGEAEGKSTKQMREIHGPAWSVWTDHLNGGETVEAVGTRADHVIDRALATVPNGGAVALFAHAHILRILAARWIGRPAVDGRLFSLGTGSVSVLGFERETRVIAHWNRGFESE
ncbi:MAG: histidine phosphatase family protein [Janthinobacterium lividum]